MFKDRVVILVFILFFFIYLLNEFNVKEATRYTKLTKKTSILNDTVLNDYQKIYNETRDLNAYWGIDKKYEYKEGKKYLLVTKEKDKNILCINKSCFRLISIYKSKNDRVVVLYNKDLKPKIKDYIIENELKNGIIVSDINTTSVQFVDKNSSRKWRFKMFEVDEQKYKPKESK
ncbi:MAG: hypothetical protein U9N59_13480 [Campylobacterota bacterium]|nr:hypothetical protein [Campylobacterota bacterium]